MEWNVNTILKEKGREIKQNHVTVIEEEMEDLNMETDEQRKIN